MKNWMRNPHSSPLRRVHRAWPSASLNGGIMLAVGFCLLAGSAGAKPLMLDTQPNDPSVMQSPAPSGNRIEPTENGFQAKPASQTETAARPKYSGKKTHPVVIAPEPLLPNAYGATNRPLLTNTQTASVAYDIASDATIFNNKNMADAELGDKRAMRELQEARRKAEPPPSRTRYSPAQEPGVYPVSFAPTNARVVYSMQDNTTNTALSHYNRGVYYSERKEWAQAIGEYHQALQQNILLADAYVGLSTAALHQRDWENALRNGHQALRLKDNFLNEANMTQARYNLSTVYCVADDYTRAARYYEQVVQAGAPEAGNLWAFLQSNCHP